MGEKVSEGDWWTSTMRFLKFLCCERWGGTNSHFLFRMRYGHLIRECLEVSAVFEI